MRNERPVARLYLLAACLQRVGDGNYCIDLRHCICCTCLKVVFFLLYLSNDQFPIDNRMVRRRLREMLTVNDKKNLDQCWAKLDKVQGKS
jgi:hypothetical protein